ncbi:hypothetical protein AX15_005451 [Amanita polypyramis BW_CC]|nr:hypothetical protein AX15_005451 [Amanita polypyramis BW_CC]
MHADVPSTVGIGAGRYASMLKSIPRTGVANKSTGLVRDRFADDMALVGSPVPSQVSMHKQEEIATGPGGDKVHTPIHKRVGAFSEAMAAKVDKTLQRRRKIATLASGESFVIVCSTPERTTKMTSPPPVLRRKVECGEVSDEVKEEYAAWVRKR